MTKIAPNQSIDTLPNFPISACIVSLASNFEPDYYLNQVIQVFHQQLPLLSLQVSNVIVNNDKNFATTKLVYHNQMAILNFLPSLLLPDLISKAKMIEAQLHRHDHSKPTVTIDIDVLAFRVQQTEIMQNEPILGIGLLDYEKNGQIWYKILRRFPLALYEQQGINALFEKNHLNLDLYQKLLA